MVEIARDDQQITVYYNPDSSIGKKTLAYLQSSKVPVLTINLLEDAPTGSQWLEIVHAMDMELFELVLRDHPVFSNQYLQVDLETEDWLKIMQQHPEVIDQPIAIRGDKVLLIRTPTDILQLLEVQT